MSSLSTSLFCEQLRKAPAAYIASNGVVATAIAQSFTGGNPVLPVGEELQFNSRQLLIENLTDVLLFFSIQRNGGWSSTNADFTDRFVLPSGGLYIQDVTTNRTNLGTQIVYPIGYSWAVVAAAGSPPTTGAVYLSSWYGLD
jgi:hypothetical protein